MSKIIVDGYKLIGTDNVQSYSSGKLSRFELKLPTPSEISKLKAGDVILSKAEIFKTFAGIAYVCSPVEHNNIIAILPQPQPEYSKQDKDGNPIWEKPQQEFCECFSPFPRRIDKCNVCGKPLSPQSEKLELASEEELRDIIHKHTSEMLDNPDAYGIYPTTKFYNNLIHALVGKVSKSEPKPELAKEKEIEAHIFSECEKVSQEYQRRIESEYIPKTLLASEEEIEKIIYTELKRQYKDRRLPPKIKIGKLVHALVGKVGKSEPKSEIEELDRRQGNTTDYILDIVDKLNEIIKHINRKD